MTAKRWIRLLLLGCLLVPVNAAVAQASRPRASSPARGVPTLSADAASVLRAYRSALRQPTARNASRAVIQRQLRTNRPIAFVAGYWVTPVDLSALYNHRSVRAGLVDALPAASRDRFGQIVQAPQMRIGLAFTPMDFGDDFMGDLAADLTQSIGVDAFRNKITEDGGVTITVILVSFAVGVASGVTANAFWDWWNSEETPTDPNTGHPIDHPNADPDGDGDPNWSDSDDDDDGAPDSEDQYPHDPNKTICMCSGMAGIAFGNQVTDQIMATLISAYSSATVPSANSTAIGAARGTRTNFGIVFPMGLN